MSKTIQGDRPQRYLTPKQARAKLASLIANIQALHVRVEDSPMGDAIKVLERCIQTQEQQIQFEAEQRKAL